MLSVVCRTTQCLVAIGISLLVSSCGDSRAEMCEKTFRHIAFLTVEEKAPLGRTRAQIEYDADRLFRSAPPMNRLVQGCINEDNPSKEAMRCVLRSKSMAESGQCEAKYNRR